MIFATKTEQILALVAKRPQVTTDEIAAEIGCAKSWARKVIAKTRLDRKPVGYKMIRIIAVAKKNPQLSAKQIGHEVGCSYDHVWKVLRRHHIRLQTSRKPHRRLLEWEREAIAQAYKAGEKLESVAAEFGIDQSTVSRAGIRYGLPRRLEFHRGAAA